MAIQTTYNFKGIEVQDAIIKVTRIFGSSKEGWNSLVGVYNQTTEVIPGKDAVEAIGVEGEEGYVPAIEATVDSTSVKLNLLEEFNFYAEFKEDERGYTSIYKALTEKFGGIEI